MGWKAETLVTKQCTVKEQDKCCSDERAGTDTWETYFSKEIHFFLF